VRGVCIVFLTAALGGCGAGAKAPARARTSAPQGTPTAAAETPTQSTPQSTASATPAVPRESLSAYLRCVANAANHATLLANALDACTFGLSESDCGTMVTVSSGSIDCNAALELGSLALVESLRGEATDPIQVGGGYSCTTGTATADCTGPDAEFSVLIYFSSPTASTGAGTTGSPSPAPSTGTGSNTGTGSVDCANATLAQRLAGECQSNP
jgi:hypothetical protein